MLNIKYNFDDWQFWFLKGYTHMESGQLDSTIDSFGQALRVSPSHQIVLHDLACVYE